MEPLCEAKEIRKDFFLPHDQVLHVLDSINITIYPKEVVAIIGPSGCGKSTFLRILAGLEPPTQGKIFYDGKAQKGLLPCSSMVFQSFALYPWMTVRENVEVVLKAMGDSSECIEKKAREALSLVGLKGFEESYPREISGGMKQRVGLARALVRDPKLLLMDEPFSAVDAFTAEGLRAEVLNIWAQKDRALSSILLISHDIKEVVYMADRIIVFEANPARVHFIIENKLPRPRDYRSLEFMRLVDRLHETYAHATGPKVEPLPLQEISTPLLPVSSDEILGLLHHIHQSGNDSQDLYKIGAETGQHFDRIILVTEAAELLNFVEIVCKTVTLTTAGKTYLSSNDQARRLLWREQLLTIPLFIKVCHSISQTKEKSLSKAKLMDFLAVELPHEDVQVQFRILTRWGHYGGLLSYHRKSQLFTLNKF